MIKDNKIKYKNELQHNYYDNCINVIKNTDENDCISKI